MSLRLFRRRTRCLCPVCGQYRFKEKYDICEICGWENDPVQNADPDFAGGANDLSLNQAREAYNRKTAEEHITD